MFKKNQGELRETGREVIRAAERIFLFTRPEQMASVHPRLAFLRVVANTRRLFFFRWPTHAASRLSPARAVMHGCICVLTIMCSV